MKHTKFLFVVQLLKWSLWEIISVLALRVVRPGEIFWQNHMVDGNLTHLCGMGDVPCSLKPNLLRYGQAVWSPVLLTHTLSHSVCQSGFCLSLTLLHTPLSILPSLYFWGRADLCSFHEWTFSFFMNEKPSYPPLPLSLSMTVHADQCVNGVEERLTDSPSGSLPPPP